MSAASNMVGSGKTHISKAELLKGPVMVLAVEKDNALQKLKSLIEVGIASVAPTLSFSTFSSSTSPTSSSSSASSRQTNSSGGNSIDSRHKSMKKKNQGVGDENSDNVFDYRIEDDQQAVGSSSGGGVKSGVLYSQSQKEATQQLVYFFDELYGVNNITSSM